VIRKELSARDKRATKNIQHPAKFLYQFERSGRVAAVTKTQFAAKDQLRVEFSNRTFSV
jgi:hypothetical protein